MQESVQQIYPLARLGATRRTTGKALLQVPPPTQEANTIVFGLRCEAGHDGAEWTVTLQQPEGSEPKSTRSTCAAEGGGTGFAASPIDPATPGEQLTVAAPDGVGYDVFASYTQE